MTARNSADDYFKNIVKALEEQNVEDLIYARRDHYNIMPADPSFPVDKDERQALTKELNKLSATFWDNEKIAEDLDNFPENHFPELKDWVSNLITVASERQQLERVFNKHQKAPPLIIQFFRNFYTSSERQSTKIRKNYLLKLQSSKGLTKWHTKFINSVKKAAPLTSALYEVELLNSGKKRSFRLFKTSGNDNSGNVGCLIFVLIWIAIKFLESVL
ncbi:MAG: hypothetical protein MK132_02225 [Lentisphaerales bacterium]|nr:hypothetical protein [Lentisphaerales bacterium]